jgi:zinc D-Ala-D-Ala carboxypeptidase
MTRTSTYISGGVVAAAFFMAYRPVRIGKYYTLQDVIKSDTASAENLTRYQEEINRRQINAAKRVARKILEPVILFLDAKPIITSWYRSPELNQEIGGAPGSKHMDGDTVDLVFFYMGARRNDLLARAIIQRTKFDRIILERGKVENPRWIHVEAPDGKQGRGIILYTPDGKNYYSISKIRALQLFG